METQAALIIAQVLGPLYLVAGLGLAAHPARFAGLLAGMETSPAQTFTWGFVALGLGLLILAVHPGWTADWTLLVTLIGWLAAAKGALLLLAPGAMARLVNRLFPTPARLRAWAIVPLALGGFLAAMGFGPG